MDGTVTGEASASSGEAAPEVMAPKVIVPDTPIDTLTVEITPADAEPPDVPQVETLTVEITPADAESADVPQVETPPLAIAPADAAIDALPVDAAPLDAPSVEGPSVTVEPADSSPVNVVPIEVGYGGTESGALFDVDMPVRLPSTISPSRAGDFMQCPLLFRFRVVDRIPEPPSAAAVRGTLVHAVLDRLFDLPAGGRTPQEAAALLQPEWERLLAKEPELGGLFAEPDELTEWLASAKSLLGKYFTLEDPNRLEPAERELFVRAVVGEGEDRFVLRGIVDRLDIAPNGLLRVVDYKTGKAPPAGYEAKNLFQMKFYALVLWKVRGVVPKRLQLIFLGSGDVLTYDPDERDLLGVERKITAVWAAIRSAAQKREWPPSPSRLCDWCSFKPVCSAHGGEVSPAPQVEFLPAVKEPEAA